MSDSAGRPPLRAHQLALRAPGVVRRRSTLHKTRAYDPEVALAVRFGGADATPPLGADEDEDGLDGFNFAYGRENEAAVGAEARTGVASVPVSATDSYEDTLAPSSAAFHHPSPFPHAGSDDGPDAETERGFDDDFADFVAAGPHMPIHMHLPAHGAVRLPEVMYDVGRLTPMHPGASYRSLGSVFDVGEGNDSMSVMSGAYGALDDDDGLNEGGDPAPPGRAEILETSRRLFGAGSTVLDVR
ncbi:uncharacterized protein BXZ73DRAFT_101183 [Epithele typhae]|uniref:uncharacterized protein n=1 Tax=Epithele typhae TaxID=378194 RepID=UPI002007F3A3|nr:uncharacterized protein BXZ73DRAFT_101183 [Epithele typhae]KAH9933224.1 hypothetical protein BXZ73DRAFT_101183 [Epithele typhae]